MKVHTNVLGVLFCGGFLIGTAGVFAQENKPADKKPAAAEKKPATATGAAGQPSPEGMAKMMQMGTPGEFHAKLKPLTGKWTFTTKARTNPEKPWDESTGTSEYKWILGGRVLAEEVKHNPVSEDAMVGAPFEGFALNGYDNMSKKYWNTWVDSTGTGIMVSTGTVDASGKTFTYFGEYDSAKTGQRKTTRYVLKIAGDDKLVFEIYDKGPDGKEYMNLEITYARVK